MDELSRLLEDAGVARQYMGRRYHASVADWLHASRALEGPALSVVIAARGLREVDREIETLRRSRARSLSERASLAWGRKLAARRRSASLEWLDTMLARYADREVQLDRIDAQGGAFLFQALAHARLGRNAVDHAS